jgi:hypothetical protein
MSQKSATVATILSTSLASAPSSVAWLMPAATTTRSIAGSVRPLFAQRPGVFFGPEEEFECPEEEECEIDWDRMPGFADEGEAEHNVETEPSVQENSHRDNKNPVVEYTNIGDEDPADDELQPIYDHSQHKIHNSVEKTRTFYEMSWQVDECNVEPDTCSDFCPDCAGSGRQFCKFCRGTRTIAFGKEFRSCLICDVDGRVECAACRGTGSVAPWAATHDQRST